MPRLVAGIDEAGRGPLAGPVVAASVILDPANPIEGLGDSKKIARGKRERLFDEIHEKALSVAVGVSQRVDIDRLNILNATIQAMQISVDKLSHKPDHLQIDGKFIKLDHPSQETIIGGDGLIPAIGAASIVAKVTRDRIMVEYDKVYPEYHFASHMGYGTKAHMEALARYGATPIHRQSFRPVSEHLPKWSDVKDKRPMGKLGEQLAATYLIEKGYRIADLNYNVPHYGELDIVALHDNTVVICEVKSQKPGGWGPPEVQIDAAKRDRIMTATQVYCEEKEIDSDIRFDVISVLFTKDGPRINHIESGIHAD